MLTRHLWSARSPMPWSAHAKLAKGLPLGRISICSRIVPCMLLLRPLLWAALVQRSRSDCNGGRSPARAAPPDNSRTAIVLRRIPAMPLLRVADALLLTRIMGLRDVCRVDVGGQHGEVLADRDLPGGVVRLRTLVGSGGRGSFLPFWRAFR